MMQTLRGVWRAMMKLLGFTWGVPEVKAGNPESVKLGVELAESHRRLRAQADRLARASENMRNGAGDQAAVSEFCESLMQVAKGVFGGEEDRGDAR